MSKRKKRIASCDPAASIIKSCGGKEAYAKLLGISTQAAYMQMYPAHLGGGGGVIPSKYHLAILTHLAAKGHFVSPYDLYPQPNHVTSPVPSKGDKVCADRH